MCFNLLTSLGGRYGSEPDFIMIASIVSTWLGFQSIFIKGEAQNTIGTGELGTSTHVLY